MPGRESPDSRGSAHRGMDVPKGAVMSSSVTEKRDGTAGWVDRAQASGKGWETTEREGIGENRRAVGDMRETEVDVSSPDSGSSGSDSQWVSHHPLL